ncbi:hypothetical protein [Streptomyces sp. NPDC006875]|uniref:hypothetical protein n=1 Tax=Streptomyces sp. NPDC006875 TaxID=3154781 RepID=UPI0033FAF2BD
MTADTDTSAADALRIPVLQRMKSPEAEVRVPDPRRHLPPERAGPAFGVRQQDRL